MKFILSSIAEINRIDQKNTLQISLVGEDNSIYTGRIDLTGKDIKNATLSQIESWAIEHARHQFNNC